MRTKTLSLHVDGQFSRPLEQVLSDAIDQGLRPYLEAMTPCMYVDLVTMSKFELGLQFKKALRDELYERLNKRRRTA